MLNSFKRVNYYDHVIMNGDEKVGTLRVKPSTVMWKERGAHMFKAVSMQDFADWIMSNSGAREIER